MFKISIPSCALILILISTAYAQSSTKKQTKPMDEPSYIIRMPFGEETMTCANFLNFHADKNIDEATPQTSWASGFVSGNLFLTPKSKIKGGLPNSETVKTYIKSYCEKHMTESWFNGVAGLLLEIIETKK